MFITIVILIALPILGWAVWFVFALARYVFTGGYEIDKRLDRYTRR